MRLRILEISLFAAAGVSVLIGTVAKAQMLEYTNLPLVHVQSSTPPVTRDVKVAGNLGFLDNGINYFNHLRDIAPSIGLTIEVRGQSSASFAKKQYNVEFHELGDPEKKLKVPFLGLPEHDQWVLAAPYFDPTLMRNRLAFWVASFLYGGNSNAWYASRTRPFELFLNGHYQGVYVLTEKIDGSANRVNIKKTKLETPEQNDFIVKMDPISHKSPGDYFWTTGEIGVSYYEPKAKKLRQYSEEDPILGARLYSHIQGTINQFEHATQIIPTEAVPRYRDLIEPYSFINYILIQEIFKNIDGFRRSVYMTYKDGRLHLGPIWDFDVAMGQLRFYGQDSPEGFQIGHGRYANGNHEIPWFVSLLRDPWFSSQLIETYKMLRADGYIFSTSVLMQSINANVAEVDSGPQQRNFSVWNPNGSPLDGPIYLAMPKYINFHYLDVVGDMKWWLEKRLEWLDRHIDEIVHRRP